MTVMCTNAHDSGHCSWNHSPLDVKDPQPYPPDTSNVSITEGGLGCRLANAETPFQSSRKVCHQVNLTKSLCLVGSGGAASETDTKI